MRKSNYNLLILLGIFLISLSYISAEILFTQQVNSVYNLGDEIFVPLKIKSVSEAIGVLELNLICNNNSINFYKNGIKLKAGEEKSFDSYLVLIKEIIGTEKGKCNIKAVFNEEYSLSEEFRISNLLIINPEIASYEFDVGQSLEITGKVTKENSQGLEGFLEVRILDENNNIKLDQTQTVNQGNINFELILPKDLESKEYIIKFVAYEKDFEGKIINEGQTEKTIYIKQLPTHLEINTNFDEIIPGDYLKISSKLKDQTNKEINSTTLFILKDAQDKILEQKEIVNGEELEYFIPEKEAPAQWKIIALSQNINSEKNISIKAIEKIAIDIVNKTLILTNEGNIPYNKTLLVRIEENPINVNIELKVGETKKYTLSAPDGEYNIKLMTGEGQEVSHTLSLTGRAISVKEEKNVSFSVIGWTILIIILLLLLFRLVKKLHKKRFVGRVKKINKSPLLKN